MKTVLAVKFGDERGWAQAELGFTVALDLIDAHSTYVEMLYVEDGRLISYKPSDEICDSSISKIEDSGS